MSEAVSEAGWPPGLGAALTDVAAVSGAEWHAQINSTNRRATEAAAEGVDELYVVLADEQTAGRGRQGRTWTAPPGSSLLLSIVTRPVVTADCLPLLPLLVGLALAEAVEPLVPEARVDLKWPNDVLVSGRKLAGILVEALPEGAVVGVGLNVDWREMERPDEIRERATSLAELSGQPVDRFEALTAFLRVFGSRYPAWNARPSAFLNGYRRRCVTIGHAVQADLPTGRLQGTATAVADDGALEVSDSDGRAHRIHAGDVHLTP